MENNISNKDLNWSKILMFVLLLSFCFPNFALFYINGQKIMLYRIIVAVYSIVLLLKSKISIPSKSILLFIIYMILQSIILSFSYGYDRLLFDYIFAFFILIDVYSIGKNIRKDEWIGIIQIVSIIMVFSILINIFIQRENIIYFLKNQSTNHPVYKCIFTGGWNLEATWPALFVLFYLNKPKIGYIYWIMSSLISVLLASRIGIIINFFGFLYLTNAVIKLNDKKNEKKFLVFISFIIFSLILAFVLDFNIIESIKNRLINIGKDSGSVSRLNMWENIYKAFVNSPFGYGSGNAIKGVKIFSKVWIGEDNVHNLFFQMLLDYGFIGFIVYTLFVFNFIKSNIKDFFTNPIISFLILYIAAGLIQFKGAELITFYIIAIYLVQKEQEKEE